MTTSLRRTSLQPRPGTVRGSARTAGARRLVSPVFYVSYYDANMGHLENAVFTAEPTTNYATNYQYDPFGMEWSIGSGSSSTAYGANVFTATSTGTLKAVSFWAPYANTQYTAQVYVNPTDSSNPTSGSLVSTISGTASASYTG